MNTPMLTWAVVVTLLLIIALVHMYHVMRFGVRHDHKLIEIGRDEDEFYLPGDSDEDDATIGDPDNQ